MISRRIMEFPSFFFSAPKKDLKKKSSDLETGGKSNKTLIPIETNNSSIINKNAMNRVGKGYQNYKNFKIVTTSP